jgi:hypothetical protein
MVRRTSQKAQEAKARIDDGGVIAEIPSDRKSKAPKPNAVLVELQVSDETLRPWTKHIVRSALAELRPTHFDRKLDAHSSAREILTREGCQALLKRR